MDPSLFSTPAILGFLLVVSRISGMMISAPFFNQQGVPAQVKVALALGLGVMMFALYGQHAAITVNNLWELSWAVGQELVIGLLIGFVAAMVFASIQMAGNHIALQMGLSMASVLDPVTNTDSPVMGEFYFYMAILLFMTMNFHHSLILAVARSFQLIPLASGFASATDLISRFTSFAENMFALSMVLVLPVMGVLLVQELALAFVSKMMPNMNLFTVALPLKILVGLILVYATLPYTMSAMESTFETLSAHEAHLYQH